MSNDGHSVPPRLVLASASPRRRQLLAEAGYAFDVDPADIDEDDVPADLSPEGLAEFLAAAKAEVVASRVGEEAVVLAADTVVAAADSTLLAKPTDRDDAARMMLLLAGSTHRVITGVAVVGRGLRQVTHATSHVTMRPLSADEIDGFLDTGLWQGKAGGYGLQDEPGGQDPFVADVTGDPTNVVGLPMGVTRHLLHDIGVEPSRV